MAKMRLFKHPSIIDGRIHFEDEVFEVRAGVVQCPREIGESAGWPPPDQADMDAYGLAPRTDGPTFEEFVAAGYRPEHYPPALFAARPSPGYDAYLAACADKAAADKAVADRRAAVEKVLEGTIADVERALDGPVEGVALTAAELAALETAELSGKNRKGVLELLALHREHAAGGDPTTT